MRILFLSNQLPGSHSAYDTRLDGLRLGLAACGAQTGWTSLRQMRFARPHLLFPLNGPHIARLAQGYDVIHAGGTGAALAACVARQWGGPPVVYDVHGDEVQESLLRWQARRSVKSAYVLLQARLISAPARHCADHLLMVSRPFFVRYQNEKYIDPSRMSLVLNGVDTKTFHPAADYVARADGRTHICYAGSFQSWQAVDELVAAFQQISTADVYFHIIGFDPTRNADQQLKAQISDTLGAQVTCLDWLTKADLIRYLQYMDVLIIPRTTHPAMRGGLPSKFAEYLALGKPLIVTSVDDTALYVRQHDCGIVCEPDADSMADALRTSLRLTPSEQALLGSNARNLAKNLFDWRVIARDYLDTLHTLIQQNSSHRKSKQGRRTHA
ncbi:MAG: glycosyltransferase [Chloroflexota bacterium]